MRSVAQVSTGTYLRTFFQQSWRIHALQAIRYTLIAFCLVVIFGINPSRSAWVTVLAGITALLLTWNSRKGAVIAVILAVVCCWAGYHYSSSFARKTRSAGLEINDLLQTVFTENDSTENKPAHGRLQLYRHAVKHISGHPWGFGMLETQKKCREFSGDLLDNIHSEFLAFAMHSGWLGLAIFAALFYYLSKLSQQLAGPWKPLGLYVTATLLLACLFNGSFSQDMEGPLYCILIALLVAASLPSFTTRH